MLLLASAGVSVREYRAMAPALADALAERAVARRQSSEKAMSETLSLVLEIVVKRLIGIESAVRGGGLFRG